MRKEVLRWFVTLTLLQVVFVPAETGYAQTETTAADERGFIEVGIRQLFGNRSSSKFTEYRHIPQGSFIRSSDIRLGNLLNNTFFFNFQSRESLEKDQSYLVDLGMYRTYRLDLQWDQTPHIFTTAARSFFLESSPGVFVAPPPLRDHLQSQPEDLRALLDSARPLDLSLRRDKGSGTFTYTPAEDWALQFQYSREKQNGRRPFGTTINSFANVLELPEPIDYRTHLMKAGTEYAKQNWGFQASYSGSFFKNKVDTLVWDNPFRETDSVGGASKGRLDLYPDNTAHSVNFAGAVDLGDNTRFMASIAPGWMRQNDAFLPFTINTAIPNVPSLPGSSLNGKKQTLAMNYTLVNRAIPAVPLTVRYRSYDYTNDSRSFVFSQYVGTDGNVSAADIPRRNLPYAYDRKTLELDASWDFARRSSLKFLYAWERFDREHRDVERSHENTVGAAFDLNPSQWILFRTSYRRSHRQPEHYEANEESFPSGEGLALGQIHGLRKFDEAERSRHRAETLIQINPADTVTFGASYGTTQDDYDKSDFGLLKDITYNRGFELTYTPHPVVSFFGEYTREKFKYRQRSRQRTPASATAPANDDPNNDWENNRRDLVDTWAAGLDGSPWEKVIFNAFYSLSTARSSILTRALGSPGIAGFLVTTAQDYPDTSNRWHQVVTSVKFPLSRTLTPKLEYRYEKYNRIDFQLERLSEYITIDPATRTSIFLGVGEDVPGYNAHIVAVSLEYRF
jgi:MtrB/PioB family decaheme-associated outer membrane protein